MLSIKDYELYSGDSWALSAEDWAKIEKIAELRLSRFLCLTELPEPLPDELAQLLANFIAYALDSNANSANIESKTVRNFTIKFNKEAANAWQQLGQNFADTIDAYSQCPTGIDYEATQSICGENMGTPCIGPSTGPVGGATIITAGVTATAEFSDGSILISKDGKVEGLKQVGTNYIEDGAITEAKLSAGVENKFTTETEARKKADEELQKQVTANGQAIAQEKIDRTAGDKALDDKIKANTQAINGKQDALTDKQLSAVNSGITDKKVARYDDLEEFTAERIIRNIAHRGASMDAPENTLKAFELAGTLGFWGAETDIQETADGYYVCLHDTTVDRTTDGTGAVNTLTLEQVQALNIDTGANIGVYPGLKIPTFADYLDTCKRAGIVPIIELKTGTIDESDIAPIYEMVASRNMEKNSVVISFDKPLIEAMRALDPNIKIQYLVKAITDQDIDYCQANSFGIDTQAIDAQIVEKAHAKDVEVNCWTMKSEQDYLNVKNLGIDYVTSDSMTYLADGDYTEFTNEEGVEIYKNQTKLYENDKFVIRRCRTQGTFDELFNNKQRESYDRPANNKDRCLLCRRITITDKYEGIVPENDTYDITMRCFDKDNNALPDMKWLPAGPIQNIPAGAFYFIFYARRKDNGYITYNDVIELNNFGDTIIRSLKPRAEEPALEKSAEGNPITLTDAGNFPVVGYRVKGASKQARYEGYNLWGYGEEFASYKQYDPLLFMGDGTYVLKADKVEITPASGGSAQYVGIRIKTDTGEDRTFELSPSQLSLSFNSKGTINFIGVYANGGYATSQGATAKVANLVLCKIEDADKPYEPYVGGAPAPSPSYPQEIEPVTITAIQGTGGNLTDGHFVQGDLAGTKARTRITNDNTPYLEAGEYTFYTNVPEGTNILFGMNVNITPYPSPNWGDMIYDAGWHGGAERYLHFKIDRGGYAHISMKRADESVISPDQVAGAKFMLTKGRQERPYEPYKGGIYKLSQPVKLYAVGPEEAPIYDYIDRDGTGTWGVYRRTDRFTVQNQGAPYVITQDDKWLYAAFANCSKYELKQGTALCDKFIGNPNLYGYKGEGIQANSAGETKGVAIKILLSRLETPNQSGLYKWVSANPLDVVAVISNPYFEPLPEADQIALDKLRTFEPTTIFATQGEQEVRYLASSFPSAVEIALKGKQNKLIAGAGIKLEDKGKKTEISVVPTTAEGLAVKSVTPSITAQPTIQPLNTSAIFLENVSGLRKNSHYMAIVSLGQFDMNAVPAQLSLNSSGATRSYYITGGAPGSYALPVKTNGSGIVNIDAYIRAQGDQPITGLKIAQSYIDLYFMGAVEQPKPAEMLKPAPRPTGDDINPIMPDGPLELEKGPGIQPETEIPTDKPTEEPTEPEQPIKPEISGPVIADKPVIAPQIEIKPDKEQNNEQDPAVEAN